MSFRTVFFAGLLAAGLFGCGKQLEPRHIVILIDVSGSIDRQALHGAFKAIDEPVGHLHRGDRIAIIPILGDAEAEASGRIIRFEVPANRQAYDSDLKSFQQKLKTSLAAMEMEAITHPGTKTDILGAVALAGQEFESATSQLDKELVILTDFIQEDREFDFSKERHFIHANATREFAAQLVKRNTFSFKDVAVYLGLMRSSEYSAMDGNRRKNIQEFWVRYFKSSGGEPRFFADGAGLMQSKLAGL